MDERVDKSSIDKKKGRHGPKILLKPKHPTIITFLCRWASCRGALPQPFVVFFLAASGVSAPRRRRLLTLGLTLLALRTFAEVLHAYIHGSDGWDDETLYERHKKRFEQQDQDTSSCHNII